VTPGYLEALDILGAVEAAKQRGEKGPFVALGLSYGARASPWAAVRPKEISAVIADSGFVSIYGTLKLEATRVGSDPNASFGEKVGLRMANTLSESSLARGFVEAAYKWRTGSRMPAQFDDVMPAISQIGKRPMLFIVGEKDRIATPSTPAPRSSSASTFPPATLSRPGAWSYTPSRAFGWGSSSSSWRTPT